MKTSCLAALLSVLMCSSVLHAEDTGIGFTASAAPASVLPVSLRHEVDAAIERSLDWLAAQQHEDGSWSSPETPALTGLALWAFARSGHPDVAHVTSNAVRFLLSCRQSDGGIYVRKESGTVGGLETYNTAICMTALFAADRKELTPVLLKARDFMARSQHHGSDRYFDGFAYNTQSGQRYASLLTAIHSAKAMHATSGIESERPGAQHADIDWADTVEFLTSTNSAGQTNAPPGEAAFRTYGSMTYAGLLAMIYANVSPQDVRVRSALDWAMRHWSLEENPGMGQEGLYFFYNVLTRALDAAGVETITLQDGSVLSWREALANKLVSLQRTDNDGAGYWQNKNAGFWENDPVLATAYCLLALQLL